MIAIEINKVQYKKLASLATKALKSPKQFQAYRDYAIALSFDADQAQTMYASYEQLCVKKSKENKNIENSFDFLHANNTHYKNVGRKYAIDERLLFPLSKVPTFLAFAAISLAFINPLLMIVPAILFAGAITMIGIALYMTEHAHDDDKITFAFPDEEPVEFFEENSSNHRPPSPDLNFALVSQQDESFQKPEDKSSGSSPSFFRNKPESPIINESNTVAIEISQEITL